MSSIAIQTFESEANWSSPTMVRRLRRRLGWFVFALALAMSVGTLFKPLGSLGETRVADWIDLLSPFAVLGCAVLVLGAAASDRGPQIVFFVGGVAFALGHGLHVAANSISNVDDEAVAKASIVHLWDEVVSHYIGSSGLYLVLVALIWALRGHPTRLGASGHLSAAVVGVTLANTYIEGDVAWLGLAFLISGIVAGLSGKRSLGSRAALVIGGAGVLIMASWGLYWYATNRMVFPEFTDVGWI